MALDPVLIRDVAVAVDGGATPGTPNYLDIAGITKFSHKPSSQTADASTFDAAGRTRNLYTSRGDEFDITALRIGDTATGAVTERDPGQSRCETLGKKIGQAAIASFKITFPEGGTVTFDGTCEVTLASGGTNDLAEWDATIQVYGTPVFAP